MFLVWFAISFTWLIELVYNVQGEIHWKVEKPVSKYGQELVLYCLVGQCCIEQAGWSKNGNTIFLDVRVLYALPDAKYDGLVNRTGFSLIIRNLTETDVNQTYSCSHGFIQSNFKFLSVGDAFINPGACVQVESRRFEDEEQLGTVFVTLWVILPVVVISFIITIPIIIYVYYKRCQKC